MSFMPGEKIEIYSSQIQRNKCKNASNPSYMSL